MAVSLAQPACRKTLGKDQARIVTNAWLTRSKKWPLKLRMFAAAPQSNRVPKSVGGEHESWRACRTSYGNNGEFRPNKARRLTARTRLMRAGCKCRAVSAA